MLASCLLKNSQKVAVSKTHRADHLGLKKLFSIQKFKNPKSDPSGKWKLFQKILHSSENGAQIPFQFEYVC